MLLTLLAIAAVAAPITEVTVYTGHARVVRTASLVLAGRQTVELPALPATAEAASVRLEAEGAEVQSLELRHLGADEDRSTDSPTRLEIEKLDEAIASVERQQQLYIELTAVAGWKPAPPEDAPLPAGRLDPRGWGRALDFVARFCDRMDRQRRALDRRLLELRAERAQHPGGAEEEDEPLVNALFSRRPDRGGGAWRVIAAVEGHGPARLHLSYLIPGAEWTPSYEVRLDARREQVSLALSAVVSQQTGEDWPGARLTLSTANPARLSTPARLADWRIGERDRFVPEAPQVPVGAPRRAGLAPAAISEGGAPGTLSVYVFDQGGAPLKGVRVEARSADAANRTAYTSDEGLVRFSGLAPGNHELIASAPKLRPVTMRGIAVSAQKAAEANIVMEVSTQVEEVKVLERAPVVSTTTANVKESFDIGFPQPSRPAPRVPRKISLAAPASVHAPDVESSFAALLPDSVRSGQPPRRIPLQSWTFPASLRRTLYPALSQEAFVLANLRSPTEGRGDPRLPAGEASLFVGDDPAGTADLQPLAPGQTFELPVGLDRDVRATRRVTMATRQEGLLRRREVNRYTVTLEITNPHPGPVRVTVHEQIPIAGHEQVASALLASTPAASLHRETGALSWQLDLRPAQITRVSFVYELRYPRGHRLRQEGGQP